MKVPRVSDAEWEVMKVIWRRSPEPTTAHDVVEALASSRKWSAATIKTLLNRLLAKGALRYETDGKAYLYYPAVAEEKLRAAETDSFVARVFDGSLSPMIAHLARSKRLSEHDFEELERILKSGRTKP